jgi:hypothetical protein
MEEEAILQEESMATWEKRKVELIKEIRTDLYEM